MAKYLSIFSSDEPSIWHKMGAKARRLGALCWERAREGGEGKNRSDGSPPWDKHGRRWAAKNGKAAFLGAMGNPKTIKNKGNMRKIFRSLKKWIFDSYF
jgi:hypothetical protein